MSENSINYISISPITLKSDRPLWSVVIPTYNCANYLKETLQSVLEQDPGETIMEIIVVDDHSTKDDPEAVVQQYGQGRVQFIRQKENVGKSKNYTTGIAVSKGHYIHLLHGDDSVSVGFYSKIQEIFETNPKASAAFCKCDYIDADGNKIGDMSLVQKQGGIIDNFIEQIAVWQVIQPPSIVFKREVYENLGTYDLRLKYIEDWEFYVRAAMNYPFAYLPDNLAQYRIFPQNSSSQSAKGGKRVKTVYQVLNIIDTYLTTDIKNKINQKRARAAALYVLSYIPKMIQNRDIKGFYQYSKAFFYFNKDWRLYGRWLRFIIQYKKFV